MQETLTYLPTRTLTHGVYRNDEDEEDDYYKEDIFESAYDPDSNFVEDNVVLSSQYTYNDAPIGISDDDEPTLKNALAEDKRHILIFAIDEEFYLLVKNKT